MRNRNRAGGPFEKYPGNYLRALDAGIRASGENGEFFARLKADLVVRELPGHIPRDVLDFGCGVGHGTCALAEALPRSMVVGCDPSRESLREAQRRPAVPGGVRFVHFEGRRLPFRSSVFDVVFTSGVLHHVESTHHAALIAEAARVLRPGGAFFVFEHNPFNPLTRRTVARCVFDEDVLLLRPWYAREKLRAAGLSVARPRFYFFFPRFLARLRRLERFLGWCPIGAQYYVRATRP